MMLDVDDALYFSVLTNLSVQTGEPVKSPQQRRGDALSIHGGLDSYSRKASRRSSV